MERRISPQLCRVMAIISFIVAFVPASGLVMTHDVVGRIIFAGVWILIGIAWLGQAIRVKKFHSS